MVLQVRLDFVEHVFKRAGAEGNAKDKMRITACHKLDPILAALLFRFIQRRQVRK